MLSFRRSLDLFPHLWIFALGRPTLSNTDGGGSLDTDKASLAMLQYLNTPLRGVNRSPAQLAAGRHLRDGVQQGLCSPLPRGPQQGLGAWETPQFPQRRSVDCAFPAVEKATSGMHIAAINAFLLRGASRTSSFPPQFPTFSVFARCLEGTTYNPEDIHAVYSHMFGRPAFSTSRH
ncbi:hypothetical protein GWK47_031084 [Chionoecetes opilio]|uniref:Uncharacterized protein n=1 Tax=Chionoecetes opilio TaxID=41210 RepID=A0A8J4YJ54_CHIOP|nr:hypothetical protein GWK47_031084 [Chionoecetes opilio]